MSKRHFLEFEQPIADLETKIEELRFVQDDSAVDISEEISRLQKKSNTLTKDIYGKLSSWQISQVARHPQRPYTLDYVQNLFTDFDELHGDRSFAEDPSIVGGLARFNGNTGRDAAAIQVPGACVDVMLSHYTSMGHGLGFAFEGDDHEVAHRRRLQVGSLADAGPPPRLDELRSARAVDLLHEGPPFGGLAGEDRERDCHHRHENPLGHVGAPLTGGRARHWPCATVEATV